MTYSAIKSIKLTILALLFTTACVPVAFEGLPLPAGQSPSPNPRAELCNLLSKVGLSDQIPTCLTATSITDAQKAALCDAAAQLSDADKDLLRANLPADAISSCPILAVSPTATPTAEQTAEPTVTTGPTSEPTSEQTAAPATTATATAEATPSPSPTAGTGGGGGTSGGGLGAGNQSAPKASVSVDIGISDDTDQELDGFGNVEATPEP